MAYPDWRAGPPPPVTGWVAASSLLWRAIPGIPWLQGRTPAARIGTSIDLFYLPPAPRRRDDRRPTARRQATSRARHAAHARAGALVVLALFHPLFTRHALQVHDSLDTYLRADGYLREIAAGHVPPQLFAGAISAEATPCRASIRRWATSWPPPSPRRRATWSSASTWPCCCRCWRPAWAMYHFAYSLTGRADVAFLGGLLYVTFPYRFTDVLQRSAVAESWTFVWFPLLFAGAWQAIRQGRVPWYFALSVAGSAADAYHHRALLHRRLRGDRAAGPAPRVRRCQSARRGDARSAPRWPRGSCCRRPGTCPECGPATRGSCGPRRITPTPTGSRSICWCTAFPRRTGWTSARPAGRRAADRGTAALATRATSDRARSRIVMVGYALGLTWVGCIAFMIAPLPALMVLPTPFAYIQFPWRLLGIAGFLAATSATLMAAGLGRRARTGSAVLACRGARRRSLARGASASGRVIPEWARLRWPRSGRARTAVGLHHSGGVPAAGRPGGQHQCPDPAWRRRSGARPWRGTRDGWVARGRGGRARRGAGVAARGLRRVPGRGRAGQEGYVEVGGRAARGPPGRAVGTAPMSPGAARVSSWRGSGSRLRPGLRALRRRRSQAFGCRAERQRHRGRSGMMRWCANPPFRPPFSLSLRRIQTASRSAFPSLHLAFPRPAQIPPFGWNSPPALWRWHDSARPRRLAVHRDMANWLGFVSWWPCRDPLPGTRVAWRPAMAAPPDLSIVIPAYNEAAAARTHGSGLRRVLPGERRAPSS